MQSGLRQRRANLAEWLAARGRSQRISLLAFRLHRDTLPLVRAHARGRCLDAGAGRSPWRAQLEAQGVRVVSVDIESRGSGVDLVADLQRMPEVESASFDTAVCMQVLEHLPYPQAALAELARVLRPGGVLVLSAPHLSMLHELPHDYFRFTARGLRVLLEASGFEIETVRPSGGLFAFVGHPLSLALLTTLGSIPGLRSLAYAIDQVLLVGVLGILDRVAGLGALFPCNHVVVARRRAPA
jgi:SAM-dependent methyltransferase